VMEVGHFFWSDAGVVALFGGVEHFSIRASDGTTWFAGLEIDGEAGVAVRREGA